jgi:hypothetical protein
MRISPQAVDAMASTIIRQQIRSRRTWNRRFAAHFVVPQDVVSELWGLLEDQGSIPRGFRPIHLLWTLCFLKIYATENVLAGICQCHEDTFRKWVWVGIHLIKELELVSVLVCCNPFILFNGCFSLLLLIFID